MLSAPGPIGGLGLGYRPELAGDLLRRRDLVDFVEVVAEACHLAAARREVLAIREIWPVVVHGVKLSLGSAEGLDMERARRFASLAREVRSPVVSEHVSFVRAGGREIGHLTPLPWTTEAVRVMARNTAALRRLLPDVPLLLENVAWTFRYAEDAMAEGDFYAAVMQQTGCDMLLDVSNLYANAVNSGQDPLALLDSMPLQRVRMLHVAGGVFEHGFYFDTHAHSLSDAIVRLVEQTLQRVGAVPILLERDANFEHFDELARDIQRLRGAGPGQNQTPTPMLTPPLVDSNVDLVSLQSRVSHLLTVCTLDEDTIPFDRDAIERTRGVLRRKRVDDALPLLPELYRMRTSVEPVAMECLAEQPRAAQLAAPCDALRIAAAAAQVDSLRTPAAVDALALRARFASAPDGRLRARVGPFLGSAPAPDGGRIWMAKGIGSTAHIRMWRSRS